MPATTTTDLSPISPTCGSSTGVRGSGGPAGVNLKRVSPERILTAKRFPPETKTIASRVTPTAPGLYGLTLTGPHKGDPLVASKPLTRVSGSAWQTTTTLSFARTVTAFSTVGGCHLGIALRSTS